MARRLFTSESVTEGHPDKIADQISDSVLDEMLRQDPNSRVAVECLVTTGLVVVAGEVTTESYVEIPRVVRERIIDIGYDSSTKGFDGGSCGVTIAIGQQSPDIAQGVDVAFEAELGDEPDLAWREDLEQLVFRGSRFMEEVVFFHRKTRAVILADLLENFEPEKVGGVYGWLVRLAGAADPDGKAPVDLRLTFLGRKEEARASFERMLAWGPRR